MLGPKKEENLEKKIYIDVRDKRNITKKQEYQLEQEKLEKEMRKLAVVSAVIGYIRGEEDKNQKIIDDFNKKQKQKPKIRYDLSKTPNAMFYNSNNQFKKGYPLLRYHFH